MSIPSATARTRIRTLVAAAGAAAALSLLAGCSSAHPSLPANGSGVPGQVSPQNPLPGFPGQGGQGQAGNTDANADLHLLSSGVDESQASRDMARWFHYEKKTTNGFVPDDKWNVVDSANGVDISSPVGDGGASYVWVTSMLSDVSNQQANEFFLKDVQDLHVDAQDDPYPFAGGMRQDTVYTGTMGGTQVHGVATTDVFNDGDAHGMSLKQVNSQLHRWGQMRHTLALIDTHIVVIHMGA